MVVMTWMILCNIKMFKKRELKPRPTDQVINTLTTRLKNSLKKSKNKLKRGQPKTAILHLFIFIEKT